jgi:predicted permease
MLPVLETLTPVMFTIFLGAILAHKNFYSDIFLSDLNALVFWVGLPAIIFNCLANTTSIPDNMLSGFGIFLLSGSLVTVVAFGAVKFLNVDRFKVGPFVQGSFRGNLAFIAIPIVMFAMRDHDDLDEALSMVILIIAPAMIYYNVISVCILVRSNASKGEASIKKMISSILRNPLILSSVLGMVVLSLNIRLPGVVSNTLTYIGSISGPAALFCVGGALASAKLKGQWHLALLASGLKVLLLPILTYGICEIVDFDPLLTFVLLVMTASPTAVASYVLVKAMKGDEELASSIIVISTLLSVLSLSLVLAHAVPL